MKKALKNIAVITAVAFFSGCLAPLPGRKIYPGNMKPELCYRGFSMARPEDPTWFTVPDYDSPVSAGFHVDPFTKTHTFLAQVNLLSYPATITKVEEFEEYLKKKINDYSARNTLISAKTKITKKQGQPAVEYEFETDDHGAIAGGGVILRMYVKGIAVMHPTLKNCYVDAMYSERGLLKEVESRPMSKKGDSFLSHVLIYDAPGKVTKE